MKYWKEFNYSELEKEFIYTNKTNYQWENDQDRKTKLYYSENICAMDIETTSYKDGNKKIPLMYAWSLGIGNQIIYGREFSELDLFFQQLQKELDLSTKNRLICYIHNLSFEFQFLQANEFKFIHTFAKNKRKPFTALSEYGIEFRDSYILSGEKLETMANNLTEHKIKKLIGNLDYSLVRHSGTPLTNKELQYLENDVQILLYYIKEQISIYGDINKVPLTNTQRVKKYIREKCYPTTSRAKGYVGKFDPNNDKGITYQQWKENTNNWNNKRNFSQWIYNLKLTDETYSLIKRANRGGYVTTNPMYKNKVIKKVSSYDLNSSYPSVIVSEKYPISSGIDITKRVQDKNYFYHLLDLKDTGLIFDITFYDLVLKPNSIPYLTESKCFDFDRFSSDIDEDKILYSEKISTTITDIDFKIINQVYNYSDMEIGICYRFRMGYLPKEIITSVLDLYQNKTELKGIKEEEKNYINSKKMLNSIYGMMAQDPNLSLVTFNGEKWDSDKRENSLEIYNEKKTKKRFTYYAWSSFLTAYARRNLFNVIVPLGSDFIYCDTDSVKFTNEPKHTKLFKTYETRLKGKIGQVSEFYKIDYSRFLGSKEKSKQKLIGIWEKDGSYKQFKSLGSKQYLVELENGEMESTVSGIGKEETINHLKEISNNDKEKMFKNFNFNIYIKKDKTNKLAHTYIDEEWEGVVVDYLGNPKKIKTGGGLFLEQIEFTLNSKIAFEKLMEDFYNGYATIKPKAI